MMKYKTAIILCALFCAGLLSAQESESPLSMQMIDLQENDAEDIKRLSKAFGHFIGRSANSPDFSFDLEMVIEGIRDGAAGKPPPMTDQEYEQLLQLYQAKALLAISDKNLRKATDFLAGNKLKESVIELEPGKLQYETIKEGSGKAVQGASSPKIHFTGKFLDGQLFTSTEESGEAVILSLNQVIPGLKQGLIGMKEGEKRRLFVHPDLAYGLQGPFPPNSLLIFEVEVVKADAADEREEAGKESGD